MNEQFYAMLLDDLSNRYGQGIGYPIVFSTHSRCPFATYLGVAANHGQASRPSRTRSRAQGAEEGGYARCWRLDLLGRYLPHLIQTVTAIKALGASFESLTEKIDTGSATGRLVFHLFVSLAEFECNLISERTREGLKAARARGKQGGRKPKLGEKDVRQIRALMADRSTSAVDIAKRFGISRSTLYKVAAEPREAA